MTGSSVATPVNDLSTSGAWVAAEVDAPAAVTSGRLIKGVLPANLLDSASASGDKGLGHDSSRQQRRKREPVGVST